jgi:hypothetical protein
VFHAISLASRLLRRGTNGMGQKAGAKSPAHFEAYVHRPRKKLVPNALAHDVRSIAPRREAA